MMFESRENDPPTRSLDDLDEAVQVFEKLFIGHASELKKEQEEDIKKEGSTGIPANHQTNERIQKRRHYRWTPYYFKFRSLPNKNSAELFKAMSRVRWREEIDVDDLRYKLLDNKLLPLSCSVQASKPPGPDLEVEELSEYFNCFVNVRLKMSALAESMYV